MRDFIMAARRRRIVLGLVMVLLVSLAAGCDENLAERPADDQQPSNDATSSKEKKPGGGAPDVSPDPREPGLDRDRQAKAPDEGLVIEKNVKNLKIKLILPKEKFSADEPVAMTLRVTNTSGKTQELTFASSKTHDFIIKDDSGSVVWRWSTGRAFAQAFVERRLDSDEKMVSSASWNQMTDKNKPVGPGTYSVEAEFLAADHNEKVGPVEIEIGGE